MPAGQPSTTQPIAGPWLSPKVVTRKRWPKVLNDIGFHQRGCGSPRTAGGQMGPTRSRVARHRAVPEHIDYALIDRKVRGVLGGSNLKIRDQCPRRAAVGGNH